jgi:hypothetical protein
MDRLTDSNVAANLKSNYEGLQRVGIEPSVMDLRYVRLAELEEEEPKYKELLRAAMSDLEDAEDCDSCIYDSSRCPGVTGDCKFKWKHHDEAVQLLGEEN